MIKLIGCGRIRGGSSGWTRAPGHFGSGCVQRLHPFRRPKSPVYRPAHPTVTEGRTSQEPRLHTARSSWKFWRNIAPRRKNAANKVERQVEKSAGSASCSNPGSENGLIPLSPVLHPRAPGCACSHYRSKGNWRTVSNNVDVWPAASGVQLTSVRFMPRGFIDFKKA